MSKSKLEWSEKGEAPDFDAAAKFLSLLYSDAKAKALVKSLRNAKLVEHAAKDLLRAAHLPLLPNDKSHVDEDLKRSTKASHSRLFSSFAATLRADFLLLWRTVITKSALSAISTKVRLFPAELPTSPIDRYSAKQRSRPVQPRMRNVWFCARPIYCPWRPEYSDLGLWSWNSDPVRRSTAQEVRLASEPPLQPSNLV